MFDFLLGQDVLSAIIAFALVLIPAVLVHEIGHFIAAKLVGITVLEFGIGFPPRIGKLFTWRDTEFTLNALPIGGFVRPLGEDMVRPLSSEETERERQELIANQLAHLPEKEGEKLAKLMEPEVYQSEREQLEARGVTNIMAVHEAKPLPRMFFMVAGALMNFIFAFLVFVFIGLIGLPEEAGVRVGFSAVADDSVLAEIGLQEADIITALNGEHFESGQELFSRLGELIGQPVTLHIRREGVSPVEEFDLQVVPSQEMIDLFSQTHLYVIVSSVTEGTPAERAGFQPGDLITKFNDEPVMDTENPSRKLQGMTEESAGVEAVVTVLRDGEPVELRVVPRVNYPPNQGRMGIGIRAGYVTPDWSFSYIEGTQYTTEPKPLGTALEYGVDRTAFIFKMIAEFPGRLLAHDTRPEETRVISAVGVSQLGGDLLQDSIEEDEPVILLDYIALISIALGFTNLLPIPALDGGRVVFVILEMIRGKPIAPEREGMVHLMGLVFMLSIGVFFIINDLLNPVTDLLP